jgi:hypothetical protein
MKANINNKNWRTSSISVGMQSFKIYMEEEKNNPRTEEKV